jgi:manganese-dependent inorganic pyrophosphatase
LSSKSIATAWEPLLPTCRLVVGNRKQHLEYAVKNQFPAIILTGSRTSGPNEALFSGFGGLVYKSYEDTAETIRLLRMILPVRTCSRKNTARTVDDLFDEAKRARRVRLPRSTVFRDHNSSGT